VAVNDALTAFVRESLCARLGRPAIEAALLKAGWPADQVTRALDSFADHDFPIPVPRPIPQVSARDAFLYVVMFVTLVLSAYHLGSLLFELIDRALPQPSDGPPYQSTLQAVRWAVSSLIVAFPLFVFVSSLIAGEIRRDPIKRASKVRRRVTYLTLFGTSMVLLGAVTTVIYSFLGGEMTLRFALKVLTVGVIAGSIFGYYRLELRGDEREPET
jgi:Domain of unknown function (DUF5671)